MLLNSGKKDKAELPTARDIQRVLQFHNCVTLMGSHGGDKEAVRNMTLREKAEHVEM